MCFLHVFVASSHIIFAFSQAALVVGVFGVFAAARAGAVKAKARPRAAIIIKSFFIGVLLEYATFW